MEDVSLDDEREHHWRMVLEDNYGEVVNEKALLHDKGWDVYMSKKKRLLRVVILWKCQVLMGASLFGKW